MSGRAIGWNNSRKAGDSCMRPLTICCADVGSIQKNRFGWAALHVDAEESQATGTTIEGLVAEVVASLKAGAPVALGFEAPLFIPLAAAPARMTAARPGEGNRPWSAGAGTAALVTGLAESAWILRGIAAHLDAPPATYLEWARFNAASSGLFLWEAFVSGAAKGRDHVADARAAVHAFRDALPNPDEVNAVHVREDILSLIGAVLLRTGLSSDRPCLVIRA